MNTFVTTTEIKGSHTSVDFLTRWKNCLFLQPYLEVIPNPAQLGCPRMA